MEIVDFIYKLRKLNIYFQLVDGKLNILSNEDISPNLIDEIRNRKEIIINFLLNKEGDLSNGAIPRVEEKRNYSMSSAQQRLWLVNNFEDDKAAYNMSEVKLLKGNLNKIALENALETIINRHESLRTIFREDETGFAKQEILEFSQIGFKIEEKEITSIANKNELLNILVSEEVNKGFDLSNGPLVRCTLIRISDVEHCWIVVMHHIISDGWSMSVFHKELNLLYKGYCMGENIKLPPLKIQYKDYAAWHSAQLSEESILQHKHYWLSKFNGEIPVLDLSNENPRPKVLSYNGSSIISQLNKDTVNKIKKFNQSQGGTMFMALLSCVNVLLNRYTGQEDFVIGTPSAGREHSDLEDQIGFYLNTLALRTKFNSSNNFEELYQIIKEVAIGAYEHQKYPFDELVNELNNPRDLSRNPLFDVMVVLQNIDNEETTDFLFNIKEESFPFKIHEVAKFDITFIFEDTEEALSIYLNYNTDIYSCGFITQFLNHLESIILLVLENPNQKISEIEFLSNDEKNHLIENINATDANYQDNNSVIKLFEKQVKVTPNNIALELENKKITYNSLNQISNQFANYLIEKRQISPKDLICISLERSEWLIISILSVLKCGCAYIPIDENSPKDRLDYILSDSASKLLINEKEIKFFLTEKLNFSDNNLNIDILPTDILCFIYTSGSTGLPKGVKLYNSNVTNRLHWMWNEFPFQKNEVACLKTSIGFVDHLWELFGPLNKGVKSVVFSKDNLLNISELICKLTTNNVTRIVLVPSLLREILEEESLCVNNLHELKYWTCSGEEIAVDLVSKFYRLFPNSILLNIYGSTEVSADVTYFDTSKLRPLDIENEKRKSIPIGTPIGNTKIYLLDKNEKLVPYGSIGEICVGGYSLSGGYLNNKQLNFEKFVPNPFKLGDTIFKTGDFGRWNSDSNLEYFGRIDGQIKISGNRVEIGEVEQVLRKHIKVKNAVVLAQNKSEIEKELIAYYVGEVNDLELRTFIKKILPSYMIPSFFLKIDELPLTSSGKVNKKLLSEIIFNKHLDKAYFSPVTEAEKILVEIWSEILSIAKNNISRDSDFFDLGGNSIKAIRLIGVLKKRLNVNLTFKIFFNYSILFELAEFVEKSKKVEYLSITPIVESEYYPLSTSQKRLWILSKFEGAESTYNLYKINRIKGGLNIIAFQEAFNLVIGRHEILRTVFIQDEIGNPFQKIKKVEEINFTIQEEDFTGEVKAEEKINTKIYNVIKTEFDLTKGPLLKCSVFKLKNNEFILIIVMHHIISDGWSMNNFQKDLSYFYNNYNVKSDFELPKLKIQYKDYAKWSNELLNSSIIESYKKFWVKQFSDDIPLLEFPSDKIRPKVMTYKGKTISFEITNDVLEQLNFINKEQGGTLFMSLLTIVYILIHKHTNQNDIVIGSPIAGREHSDLEDQIGFYINTLALRINLSEDDTFEDIYQRVKDLTIEAYDNQLFPYDELVNCLGLKRDMAHNPLFDIMVTLHNHLNEDSNYKFNNLVIEDYIETNNNNSLFDLSFDFFYNQNNLVVSLQYNTDLFYNDQMKRLLSHLTVLIESVSSNFKQKISNIEILPEKEKEYLINKLNEDKVEFRGNETVLDLFNNQVANGPNKIALVFEENQYTYSELNIISNQFSNYLNQHFNIKPDDLIAVMLSRSEWLIISLLGVIKSGGAYVPIDPEYPNERIDFIIENSECKFLIDQKLIDDFLLVKEKYNIEIKNNILLPTNLMYCIYTSGSTGIPKGVLVEHSSVVSISKAWRKTYQLESFNVCLLQIASFSFDVFVGDMCRSIFTGGKMILCSSDIKFDTINFYKLIEKHQVSIIEGTPSLLIPLINNLNAENFDLNFIKYLIFGSDILQYKLLKNLQKNNKHIKFINSYGTTETVIDSTFYFLNEKDSFFKENTPIGIPFNNINIYILDKYNNIVPYGAIGEICIGGQGLARGYLNQPELTKKKFINSTFKNENRIYKTGDLGRWLENQNLELIGRIDDQVKIKGYRIELGEIESYINQHYFVKAAVVIATRVNGTDNEIIAYIVGDVDFLLLKSYLKERLPFYMVPNYYVKLDAIPVTINGKVNKKALPIPDGTGVESNHFIAPITQLEKMLAKIWSEVLGVVLEKIGLKSDFFDLAGDSIKAIQLVSRLRSYRYELRVSEVMGFSILEDMVSKIRNLTREINQSPITGDVFFSPIQTAFFLNDIAIGSDSDKNYYNQSFLLKFNNGLEKEEIDFIFTKLVEHHDALRMVYVKDEMENWTQINNGINSNHFNLEIHELGCVENPEHELLKISKIIKSSLNIVNGPLIKLGWFKLHDCDKLLITSHHLVIDFVSWRILFDDISTLKFQFEKGLNAHLPAKSDSFQYWTKKNAEYVNHYSLNSQLNYWQKIDCVKTDALPVLVEQNSKYASHKNIAFILTSDETLTVKESLNKFNKVQINALLIFALGKSLQRVFSICKIKIHIESHGREEFIDGIDITRTVGWFTSIYPVFLDFDDNNIFLRDLLIFNDQLKSIPNGGVGYGMLKFLSNMTGFNESKPSIVFNYFGDFKRDSKDDPRLSAYSISDWDHGPDFNENLEGESDLEITGQTIDNCLSMNIQFSNDKFLESQIELLVANYKNILFELCHVLSKQENKISVSSDFNYNKLSLEQILQIEQEYGEIEDLYSLSPMQEGLYFLAISQPDSNAYFEQFAVKLTGFLDLKITHEVYSEIINRHAALRTVFRSDLSDEIIQIVRKNVLPDFIIENITDKSKEEQLLFIDNYLKKDRNQGFDLGYGNLLRLTFIRLSDTEYLRIWSEHHLILDGWSSSIIMDEFNSLYKSKLNNLQIQLPSPKNYSNYINWLSLYNKQAGRDYWKCFLEGFENKTSLPQLKVKQSFEEYELKDYHFEIPESLTLKLLEISSKYKTTLNTIIQCAWGILLSKYNNTDDVVFGTVVSGRPAEIEGVQEMVGLFINTIPQRIRYNHKTSFNELLINTQLSFIEGESFHYLSLAEVQNQSLLGSNLLDHLVVFENYPKSQSIVDNLNNSDFTLGLDYEEESFETFEQMNYDFSLIVSHEHSLFFRMMFNLKKYSLDYIKRVESHLTFLLYHITENPEVNLMNLVLLSSTDRDYLLNKLNDTKVAYPEDKTIVDLFEEQVAKTPNNIAVVFEDTKFSYQELNELSNQLADYLRITYSIKPDDLIGIKLDRSQWMIVSILGILKSGGAYVPIDSDYPQERIDYIVEDSNCKVLLDEEELEMFKLQRSRFSKANQQINLIPTNLMYCIYTSGSTGNPKGCLLEHSGVVNYLEFIKGYQFDPSKQEVDMFSTLSFDFTVTSVYGALLSGKQLNVYPQNIELTASLNKIVLNPNSEVLKLTPAHIQLIEESSLEQSPPKSFVLGGEALTVEQIRKLKKNKGARIYNEYGPTEATVGCIVREVSADENPLIGIPIQNTEVYILDKHYHLVPYGSIGEICIGGAGLARGYLNREDLTKEKFIDNPYKPGEGIYTTGDLGRWNEDQNLEYLGRIDDQVKIRGYRIELGEIESVLSQHAQVSAAVVVAKSINGSEKELIAYTTGEAEATDLKSYLKEKLPSYMVPSYYVKLDAIPLTSNGKVNRKALPMHEGTGMQGVGYVAPITEIEKQLVKIWSTVLGVEESTLSIKADFFDLGGHSLNAILLISRIHRFFNIRLMISDLFFNSELESLGRIIESLNSNLNSNFEMEL